MSHKYTIESICHLTCGGCKNWWSYAYEAPSIAPSILAKMYCPHCGFNDSVARKEKG